MFFDDLKYLESRESKYFFTAPYLLFEKLKDLYVKLQMIIFFIMLFAYFETSVLFCFFVRFITLIFFPDVFDSWSVAFSFHFIQRVLCQTDENGTVGALFACSLN